MPRPAPTSPASASPRRSSARGRRRSGIAGWGLAGLAGISLAVVIAVNAPVTGFIPGWALGAIAAGWGLLLALAPWQATRRIAAVRREAADLARRVRGISALDRNPGLRELLLDRDDEIGDLSRAVHDALREAYAARLEARRLHRDFDVTLRRATDEATADLQVAARTDPLTGLGNRRVLEDRLDRLFETTGGMGRSLVIAALDIDYFKTVNDTLGHDVGDECLVSLARVLRENLRADDCPVRLGGDEFVIVMPGLTARAARAVAKRIAAVYAHQPWAHDAPRPTLSIGLAWAFTGRVESSDELLRRADEALYEAKRQGRNGIAVYDDARAA